MTGSTAAFALSGIYAASSLLKARDLKSFADTLVEFGVPKNRSQGLAKAIVGAEMVTAGTLIAPHFRRTGGRLSAAMLTLFSTAVLRAMRHGKRPSCHCFGTISDSPIGWRTLGRNAALATISLVASNDLSVNADRALDAAQRVQLGRAVVVAGLGLNLVLTIETLRRYGKIVTSLDDHGLMPAASTGAARPFIDTEVSDLLGNKVRLSEVVDVSRRFNLYFTDLGCKACMGVMAELSERVSSSKSETQQVLILLNTAEEVALNLPSSIRYNSGITIVLDNGDTGVAYGIAQYPSAILYDAGGQALSPLHSGPASVGEAMARSWELDRVEEMSLR